MTRRRALFAAGLVALLALSGCDINKKTASAGTTPRPSPSVNSAMKAIAGMQPGPSAAAGERLSSNFSNPGGAASGYTFDQFLTYIIKDVDKYWSGVWRTANLTEPQVTYDWLAPGETVAMACTDGATGQMVAGDSTAAYCPADDTIRVSEVVAQSVWDGQLKANTDPETGHQAGDFSVAYVVAHEYAHNLQAELGLIPSAAHPNGGGYPVYKTELHADCWAGVWANSAYYEGLLEAGDVEEAFRTTADVGDYDFTDAGGHHGTPAQRVKAFMDGYNSGVPRNCDPYLLTDYS